MTDGITPEGVNAEQAGRAAIASLRMPDERYRIMVEHSRDSITLLAPDGTIMYQTPLSSQELGYAPHAATGTICFDYIHPDDVAGWRGTLARAVRDGSANYSAYRVRDGQGQWRWMESLAVNLMEHPAVGAILVTSRDITERRQVEDDRQRLAAIIEDTPDYVGIMDARGRSIYINAAGRTMLGYSTYEDISGLPLERRYPGWAATLIKEKAMSHAAAHGRWVGESALQGSDGQEIPISQVVLAHFDDGGEVCFYSTIARDVTARRRAEAELQASEERYRLIVETALEGICTFDSDGRITFHNRRLAELLGYSEQGIEGRSFHDFIAPEFHPLADRICREKQYDGLTAHELELVRADGTRLLASITAAALHDAAGLGSGALLMITDITARRDYEAGQLVAARRIEEILESTTDAVFGLDEAWRFTYLNHQTTVLLRRPHEELLGGIFWEVLSDAVNSAFHPALHRAMEAGVTVQFDEYYAPWDTYFEVHAYPRPGGIAVFFRDVSDARRTQQTLQANEEKYRLVFEGNPQPMCVYDIETLMFLAVNDAAVQHYGYSHEEFLTMSIAAIHPPEEWERVLTAVAAVKKMDPATHRPTKSSDWVHLTRDGQRIVVEIESRDIDFGGRACRLVLATDITERRHTERALRESEDRYALAARGANDGLWDWDLRTDRIYYSPRWKAMVGCHESEIGDHSTEWFNRVHPEDIEALEISISDHMDGKTPYLECEYRLQHSDETYRWMLCRGIAVREESGRTIRMAGSQTDITEWRVAEKQLLYNAFYDALTGLPNRSLFMDRLGREMSRAKREDNHLYAVLFLDLDRFKVVNDSLGHMIGDELLQEAGRRLARCVRPTDTVARLGGDEFTVLLENINAVADAIHVAERIQSELEAPFKTGDHVIFTAASIGIALNKGAYNHPEELLRDADIAMYRAKGSSSCRHAIFDETMHVHAVSLQRMETDLRQAWENKEFSLHYQPIIDLAGGGIIGFEALLRWHHPERGMVPPGEFVPVAEDTGLIVPIGWWALGEACQQLCRWREAWTLNGTLGPPPSLRMSVNLASKQFSQGDVVERVEAALANTGIEPNLLHLEITESVIMENTASASATLARLRDRGIVLSVDDFGTGYSSLSYLHRFPVDILKIDRSFVNNIGSVEDSEPIVRTIATLARTLNVEIVAEGVESAYHLERLREIGCECGQGFYFAKPLDSAAAQALLFQQPHW